METLRVVKRRSRLHKVVAQLLNKVEDYGKVSVAALALELGYSLMYFKYQLVPLAKEMSSCLEVEGEYLVWTCPNKEETASEVKQA